MVESKRHSGGAALSYLMVGGGPGAFIGAVHKAGIDLVGAARLVGGCFSQTFEKSREQGRRWGLDDARIHADWREMLKAEAARPDRPDFVVVVTPNNTHHPIAKAALELGFHVSCDKPLCLTPAEAEELVGLSREKKLEFLVTYTYLGYPLVRQAREMVRAGDLGDIRLVVAEYAQGWLSDEAAGSKQADWRTDPARTGIAGCLGDIGTHAENLSRFVAGVEMTSLSASLDTFVKGRLVDDNGFVLYRTGTNAKGSIWASPVAVGRENGLSLRVYGAKAALEWHQENPNQLFFAKKGAPLETLTRGQSYLHPHAARYTRLPSGHPEGLFEAFANLYDAFVQTILARRAGRQPGAYDIFPTVEDGAAGVRFVHAAVESSRRDGAWVGLQGGGVLPNRFGIDTARKSDPISSSRRYKPPTGA